MNKKFLKGIDQVKEDYNKFGHDEFVRIYSKYDIFMGMTEEIDKFLIHTIRDKKEWKEEK